MIFGRARCRGNAIWPGEFFLTSPFALRGSEFQPAKIGESIEIIFGNHGRAADGRKEIYLGGHCFQFRW